MTAPLAKPTPFQTLRNSVGLRYDYRRKKLRIRWNHFAGAVGQAVKAKSPGAYRAIGTLLGTRPEADEDQTPLPPFGSTVRTGDMTMRVDERMSEFNIRKLTNGKHTLHERQLLADILSPEDRVMELGGGIGMVAIFCSRIVGSENVFSYEANPGLESLIRDNYALNDVSPTLNICMVGPEAGSREFHVSSQFSRSSVYDPGGDTKIVEVPVVPFQDEVDRIRPTVLVIDIQGGEVELIDYADFSPVRTILIEFHPSMTGLGPIEAMRKQLRNRHGFIEAGRRGNSFIYRKPGKDD